MPDYCGEKTQQVSPSGVTAFGIVLQSRYGKASELAQMLEFAELVAKAGVEKGVREVLYDSKACMCLFKLSPFVQPDDPIAVKLWEAAKATLNQFEFFGHAEHRTGCDCGCDSPWPRVAAGDHLDPLDDPSIPF